MAKIPDKLYTGALKCPQIIYYGDNVEGALFLMDESLVEICFS